MKQGIITFTLFTCLGAFQNCGIRNDFDVTSNRPNVTTNPIFQPYISEFESYYGASVAAVPIAFSKLEPTIAGVCHYLKVGNGPIEWGYIEIDQEYWKEISEKQKIDLIFHELGHCVLGRDHVTPNGVEWCPKSFMNPSVMSDYCLENHYDDYIKEMFPLWKK